MKPEPIFEAVEKLRRADSRVVLMTPQGHAVDAGRGAAVRAKPHW